MPLASIDIPALEAAEAAAWEDLYAAAPVQLAESAGIGTVRLGATLVATFGVTEVLALNRAIGFGVSGLVTASDIAEITRLFEGAGSSRFFVQVPPGARQDDTLDRLRAVGLRHYNHWVRLIHDLAEVPACESEVEVRRADSGESAELAGIVAQCFEWPVEARTMVEHTFGRPNWRHYAVELDDRLVASGAMYRKGNTAWCGLAATREDARGRGAQSALICRRLADAKADGCACVIVEAAEPTPDHEPQSLKNLLRLGFKRLYLRPNYIFEFPPHAA